jgi:hypothetical protein
MSSSYLPESVDTIDGQPMVFDAHVPVGNGNLDDGMEWDLQIRQLRQRIAHQKG